MVVAKNCALNNTDNLNSKECIPLTTVVDEEDYDSSGSLHESHEIENKLFEEISSKKSAGSEVKAQNNDDRFVMHFNRSQTGQVT
jgi:hypothetical protein